MESSEPQKPDGSGEKSTQPEAYPAATLAFYGPDDQIATKAVAAVVRTEQDDRPAAVKKWYAEDRDIRADTDIRLEMLAFFKEHGIKRVVMADRIIGCPHEEGVDYPLGENCPHCPFWAGRDRWTGKPLEE